MKDFLPRINNLLALAEQVLSSEGDYILVVEEYAHSLSALEPLFAEAANDPKLKELLLKLDVVHQKVSAKVDADKTKIRSEITSLKKKGKIVITYTDQLPKRISLGTKFKI